MALFAVLGATLAYGHDLTASHAAVRVKSTELELEVRIASDMAWPLVQDTVAPGALFLREEFETVGKGQLLAFAKLIEQMTVEGKKIPPARIDVAVVDDNFVFTLVFPRPARGSVRLTENYLTRMPPEYLSFITVVDEHDKELATKTLSEADNVMDIALIPAPAEPRAGKPSAAGH